MALSLAVEDAEATEHFMIKSVSESDLKTPRFLCKFFSSSIIDDALLTSDSYPLCNSNICNKITKNKLGEKHHREKIRDFTESEPMGKNMGISAIFNP